MDKVFVGAHVERETYRTIGRTVAQSQLGQIKPIFTSRADFIRHAINNYLFELEIADVPRRPSGALTVVRNVK